MGLWKLCLFLCGLPCICKLLRVQQLLFISKYKTELEVLGEPYVT